MLTIREFDMEKDLKLVEELERNCDIGPSSSSSSSSSKKKKKNKVSLCIDQLGDPLCRIRHAPERIMLVAEYGEKREIVGVIRACIKTVTRGVGPGVRVPCYVRVAYLLGLRVSAAHRRLGIGVKLVQSAETWCVKTGAKYAYMATDKSNTPSLNLFTTRLSYTPFRHPSILVHPVHSHPLPRPPARPPALLRLPPPLASSLYRSLFSRSDFLPSDLDSLLSHPFSLGTFLALDDTSPSPSFAITSVWDAKNTFRLRLTGASKLTRAVVRLTCAIDRMFPWLGLPSVRDVVFKPFGVYVMYGVHVRGERGREMMRGLFRVVHNMAAEDGEVAAVVAEVGGSEEARGSVPHWKCVSCEDVWCMKKLVDDDDGDDDDWSKSREGTGVLFVDPREF